MLPAAGETFLKGFHTQTDHFLIKCCSNLHPDRISQGKKALDSGEAAFGSNLADPRGTALRSESRGREGMRQGVRSFRPRSSGVMSLKIIYNTLMDGYRLVSAKLGQRSQSDPSTDESAAGAASDAMV